MKLFRMDIQKIKKELNKVNIFKLLNMEEIDYILALSEIMEFRKGEEIIKEGEISTYLYTILKGSVNVIIKREHEGNKKDIYICNIGEGDIFGEAAIFLNVERTAHVIAQDKLLLIRIERKALISFLKYHPNAGIKLLMVVIYSLLHKLKEANQELAFERKAQIDQKDIDKLINDFIN